jgi:hypothetical protein
LARKATQQVPSLGWIRASMADVRTLAAYFRANPQAFILLLICLVLGVGTFVAVLIAIAGSGSGTPSGEPTDAIFALQALLR